MPTARELLEQADALMRRNRLSEQGARDADIPELTDAIAVETAEPIEIRPVPPMLADVPELTDAVEEIEAPSILEMPDDPGEPSQWMEVDRGEGSITGAAPDSVVAVPASTFRIAPREIPVLTETIAPPREGAAPASASATALAASLLANGVRFDAPSGRDAPPATTPDRQPAIEAESAAAIGSVVTSEAEEARAREWLAEAALATAFAPASAAELAPPSGAAPESAREAALLPSPIPESEAGSVAGLEPSPASEFDREAAASPAVAPDETERWNALAEEIRMQVLQRIDIFTDTGLQKQLSARLQPIVDRASADLVATINHQVGQLLRAYVAEAIEREIEKWRQGGD